MCSVWDAYKVFCIQRTENWQAVGESISNNILYEIKTENTTDDTIDIDNRIAKECYPWDK